MLKLMFNPNKEGSCTGLAARALLICNDEGRDWMNVDDRVAEANVVIFNTDGLLIARADVAAGANDTYGSR